ncbi:MAG: TIGR03087 family PEP-CTERM/XrtA system glycosyltransferase [Phycisphaerales bacterium]|nr:TIGR03087 family PEP-CTERM/XrtA system glycosyltransferase [Phycisphaerales bacterium]
MKLLYICHRFPYPPNKGCKIRAFHTIEHLAKHHDVWCATFVDDPADMQYVPAMKEFCREVVAIPLDRLRATVRGAFDMAIDETLTEGFYRSRAMRDAICELTSRVKFDGVVVFSSSMGQYARSIDAGIKIIDLCDLDSQKWAAMANRARAPRSWFYDAEARRLAQLEAELYYAFDATILISKQEADDWIGDRSKLHVMGNGVDCPTNARGGICETKTIGFVGDMRYIPNVDAVCWFAESILPTIQMLEPDATFRIVGRSPTRRVRQLEERRGVQVTGEVDDVVEELNQCQVVVAPLRIARGVQNKVLEALAARKAVIVTSPVAHALNASADEHLVVADDPASIAARAVELLKDPLRCVEFGANAHRWIVREFRWSQQLGVLDRILTPTCATNLQIA